MAQDPLVGQVLSGKYRILAKLGEGAMAAVYLAEHQGVGATIVLKVLLPELAKEAAVVESFLREARIAAEIHHDNVIDIFYSGRSPEGFVFLAMEYVKGSTLYDVLAQDGPMPWPRAKPLLLQIAGALAAAHAIGVVHRDVKPENVLVGAKDEGTADAAEYVKVVDFGIANARGDLGGAEGVCGTPEFMPPEQAQGQRPDARDDVYAFGCLMYQVLTGDVPFRADDVPKVLLMHLREPVQPPRQRRPDLEIPAGAEAVVLRALEKRREDRWQSMAEVHEQLAAIELPPDAKPAPAPARPKSTALPAASELRSRLVMPREKRRTSARVPIILGAAVLVGAVVFGVGRHALENAPGRIEIETEPTEAEIYIDGQKMADRSPMFLDASPGTYKLVVRSPGYEPVERVLQMKPRAQDVVALALVPLAQPKATP
ncbi:MAG TPA: serine/threonine-protein kinase, partial [Polyangia bacterium]|nr:serine/threonine-protein kinase [Polyangia bacterium]